VYDKSSASKQFLIGWQWHPTCMSTSCDSDTWLWCLDMVCSLGEHHSVACLRVYSQVLLLTPISLFSYLFTCLANMDSRTKQYTVW